VTDCTAAPRFVASGVTVIVAVRAAFVVVTVVGPSDSSTVATSDSGTVPVLVGTSRARSAPMVVGGSGSAM
jgi:hypothetical protein